MSKKRLISLSLITEKQLGESLNYLDLDYKNQLEKVLEKERSTAIKTAIESLTDESQRVIARLYFFDSKSSKEISSLLSVSTAKVSKMIKDIENEIVKTMKEWEKS